MTVMGRAWWSVAVGFSPVGLASVGLVCLGLSSALFSCAPSYDESQIKTPADRLREAEEEAYREELERRKRPQTDTPLLEDPDAPGAFDDKGAELELKRATRSAEDCPAVVGEANMPIGKTAVTLTFAKDGSVAEATIPPPYHETRLGNCVLNAYTGLFVAPYTGEPHVITWDVDLTRVKPAK